MKTAKKKVEKEKEEEEAETEITGRSGHSGQFKLTRVVVGHYKCSRTFTYEYMYDVSKSKKKIIDFRSKSASCVYMNMTQQ